MTNATVAEAASHIRMTEQTFRTLVKRGIIKPAFGRGYVLEEVRAAYFDHMRKLIRDRQRNSPLDPLQERARKDRETADRVALQNGASRAALVPTPEMQAVIDLSYRRFSRVVLPLAARLAPRLVGKERVEAKIILADAINLTLIELQQGEF